VPEADLGDLRLDYSDFGYGDPVLGIMGFGLDKRFWAMQVPAVSATHRFITFDNRGVGFSTGGAPTSIDQMADDAVRLLDFLEIDKAVIFGQSMGGAIAQRLVLDHPDRVTAAIFAVTWARPLEFMRRQSLLARAIIRAEGTMGLVDATLVRIFTPQFFEVAKDMIDQMVAAVVGDTGPDPTSEEILLAQVDALDKHDTIDELPTISVPTLVLGARMDVMVPGFASPEIAAAIPGAKLQMFATGHACMVEEMDTFNSAVSDFLRSLPAT